MSNERQDLYPGYDVLAKRDTPSWNEQTREVIDARLALDPEGHSFFTDAEWATLKALVDRIVPQPASRTAPIPVAAMVDEKMRGPGDGFRIASLPPMGEAWRRGLAALAAEAEERHGRRFHEIGTAEQDAIVRDAKEGRGKEAAWAGLPPKEFFSHRVVPDVVKSYYAHPTAWNEIGWGGPASPRGYVRMDFNRRDPWEAAEAKPGQEEKARRENRRVGR